MLRRLAATGVAGLLGILIASTMGYGDDVQSAVARAEEPFVSERVMPIGLDIDLRQLQAPATVQSVAPRGPFIVPGPLERETIGPSDNALESRERPEKLIRRLTRQPPLSSAAGPALSDPILNFDGIATPVVPPDTNGDVGSHHYIQAVNNAQFAIFDKQGHLLAGPAPYESLWIAAGQSGRCAQGGQDPVVKYDRLADRWLLTRLTNVFTPGHQCIAISKTSDPVAGGWFLYDFFIPAGTATGLDYPKIGVWPDAYYMGTNFNDAWAFDRARMLNGNPAAYIHFFAPGFMLPSDLDGTALPPAGAPNVFLNFIGPSLLQLRALHVDWTNPLLSTFTSLSYLVTAPFDSSMCGASFNPDCIPQPGTTQRLDVVLALPMYRLAYRNFGDHETLVVNHSVDADGTDHAGIRWYELRKTGTGGWSIFQQGTYAPDAEHRWMGSIAMDKCGNIALGYSLSSSTVFPGIRYAGRLATDPLGTMPQGEVTALTGAASQSIYCSPAWQCPNWSRWGDYSSMSVDPMDDSTFWYTTEYINPQVPTLCVVPMDICWTPPSTRVVTFRFPSCPMTVLIDIKPGSVPNSVNPRSNGVIPVAIRTTDSFDATTVDPLSVRFGPSGAVEAHGRGHIEDIDGDGRRDLVFHFRTQDTGIRCGDTSASLLGATFDGQAIEGSDSINTVGCR